MNNINLYQLISVPFTATISEIDAAILTKYNEARRLVTHHDPTIVNQANQALQVLEQARATLLNPQRKAAYDASLGLGTTTGGLADPQAILQKFNLGITATPPSGRSTSTNPPIGPAVERADAWICPGCNTVNPIGTRFCKKCGKEIGIPCPSCQSLVEVHAVFCQKCGVNISSALKQIQEYERRKKEEEHWRQISEAEQRRITEEQLALLGPIVKNANSSHTFMMIGAGLVLVCGLCTYGFSAIFGIPFLIISVFNARKVLGQSQVLGDSNYRNKAKRAFWISTILIIVTVLAIILLLTGLVVYYNFRPIK
jgi:curved DNA-binding protein CbpA